MILYPKIAHYTTVSYVNLNIFGDSWKKGLYFIYENKETISNIL